MSDPTKASSAPWTRKTRWICPRVAPMARRMPMSLDRWITETTSTAAMPKATDSATNRRIRVFDGLLRLHGGEELRVGDDPAVGLDVVGRLDPLRDVFGRIDVGDRRLDRRDAADDADQRLRRAQGDIGVALVDPLVAEIEDADDPERCARRRTPPAR